METYAICILPRRSFVERHLRRAEAERYVEIFNRLMWSDGLQAIVVPEPVQEEIQIAEGRPNRMPARGH